jgi:hypothetical protein
MDVREEPQANGGGHLHDGRVRQRWGASRRRSSGSRRSGSTPGCAASTSNLEVEYIVHDAAAHLVDQHTFFHLRESGGTKISSAYELCLRLIEDKYPASEWNIYPFHFSDGDNWSRATPSAASTAEGQRCCRVNQFRYGQVKSAYGSGQFKKDLDQALGADERLVTSGHSRPRRHPRRRSRSSSERGAERLGEPDARKRSMRKSTNSTRSANSRPTTASTSTR